MPADRAPVLGAYTGARLSAVQLRSRADLERRQQRLWRRMTPTLARTPALARLAGQPLEAMPIVTPAEIRDGFAAWNTLGLSAERAHAAAHKSECGGDGAVAPGITAGLSTGTSGERGVFLSTRRERAQYIGHAMARLLPSDALFRRRRIALCLRADNALYQDAGGGPVTFRFFGLDMEPGARAKALAAYRPDVLIAPSHVLADLARRSPTRPPFALERLFYGAEPMGDGERAWIAGRLGMRPDPIYQATEGFLGCACRHGTLHLNEDVLVVERSPVPGTGGFQPIVTDLRRASQPMVRVKLDDFLEPLEAPCPCGSPRLAIRGVAGRIGDLWRWGDAVITPRQVTDALTAAVGPDREWRALASPREVLLEIEPELAERGVQALVALLDCRAPVETAPLAPQQGPKRRRVRWAA